ncbi:ATP synthase subunit I [Stenoxybacter acetivorans]|uniref:ATP synthase subunit I n=1 Tax=Stenoxybacter acetivorans TaxID=422441 RepID=UPI00055B1159|nr:ATP synthase subunit I [Stenoxybacter acetivorans]
MRRILIWQAVSLVAICMIFAIFLSKNAALSCLFGGLSYLMPNAAAALVLNFFRSRPRWTAISFLWGESLKVMLSILLIAAVFLLYPEVMWLPFLSGLITVSHVVFFMIWKTHYGK